MLKIDGLLTMLACLTTPELGELPIDGMDLEMNNKTLDPMGSCPLPVISELNGRLQQLTIDIRGLWESVGSLQEQFADLKRSNIDVSPDDLIDNGGLELRGPIAIGTRFDSPEIPPVLAPRSCLGQLHGVVRIQPSPQMEPFFVFCDQKTRDGGWILIANRYDGSEIFNRPWQDYKIGFGPLTTEFFIGLEKLHLITSSANYELLFLLENRKQEQRFALYDQFAIGNSDEKYILNVLGQFEGDASDAMRVHVGNKFSTYDQDNAAECAKAQDGAWWYGDDCTKSNLFGTYQRLLQRDVDKYKGILWQGFLNGPKGALKTVRMLLRPKGA